MQDSSLQTDPVYFQPELKRKFIILGEFAVKDIIQSNGPDKKLNGRWISIRGTDESKLKFPQGTNVLALGLNDINKTVELRGKPFIAPTKEEIQKAIDFGLESNKLLIIHCAAGISRSTATLMAIFLNLFKNDENVIEKSIEAVKKTAPWAKPLERIIELGLESIQWPTPKETANRIANNKAWNIA